MQRSLRFKTSELLRIIFRLSLVVLLPITFVACLRYTPSRTQVVSSRADGDVAPEYAGEKAFYELENRQTERLQNLINTRRGDSDGSRPTAYRVGPGDVLQLSVFDVPELNRKLRVRPDGVVSMPLIGTIKAGGLTEDELQAAITKKLDNFVYSPQVDLFIEKYDAHKVWVVGQIPRPGAYPLERNNYSLIELLSEAGGRTNLASSTIILIPERGKSKKVTAVKSFDGKTEISAVKTTAGQIDPKPVALAAGVSMGKKKDAAASALQLASAQPETLDVVSSGRKELRTRLALPPVPDSSHGIEIPFELLTGSVDSPPLVIPLRPGDTIVVPEAGTVQVDGEVRSPGSFSLPSRMSLMGAIAAAKGLTYASNVKNVEVIRELGAGQKALITVDLEAISLRDANDIRLRDGDLVRVPSQTGRFITQQTINVLNSVFGRVSPTGF